MQVSSSKHNTEKHQQQEAPSHQLITAILKNTEKKKN